MRYPRAIATLLLLVSLEVIASQGLDTFQNIEPQKVVLAGGTNPIEVKKTIGVFDGINNVLPVMVELKYLGRYPIDIGIVEYVQNNKIINCSGYKIIRSILEIYNDTNVPTNSIILEPYFIQFNIHNLWPKNRVIFIYYIDTKHRSDFQTQTTVRFYSEDGYPDSDYLFKMSTLPVFEVTLDAKEAEILRGESVDIKYNIKYLGPAEIDIFNVTFDLSETYKLDSPYVLHVRAKKGESITINKRVAYLNEGKYRLPGITINNLYFNFNSSITVVSGYDVFLGYWVLIFSSLVSIMALLPGVVALVPFFKRQNPIIRQRIRIRKKRDYKRINESGDGIEDFEKRD